MTGWSSSTKNPMEMQATPWASGGTIISSITTGGRSTPSMRGMENPHTSASTTATRLPRLGQRDGQVRGHRGLADSALAGSDQQHPRPGAGIGEGDGPPLGMAVGRLRAGRGSRIPMELLAQRGALLVGHRAPDDVDAARRLRGP